MLANARDTLLSRAARFQGLAGLATLPCTNVREMIFGPDPDILGAFDAARRNLARFPSDSARIDALERIATGARSAWSPGTLDDLRGRLPPLLAVGRWMGHVSARVLGVTRVARCFDENLGNLTLLF